MKQKKYGLIPVFMIGLLLLLASTMLIAKESKAYVSYSLRNGTLTVRGKGEAKRVYKKNSRIKKVVVKKGVTSLAPSMFQRCKKLTSVTLPKGLKKIGRLCFAGTNIKKIRVPKTVKTIQGCVFKNCRKLKTVTMPGNFKAELISDDEGDSYYDPIMYGETNAEEVIFNTDFNPDISPLLYSEKLTCREEDPNYTSVDGVIYTKDGKEFVRMGAGAADLDIAEGCETVHASGMLYGFTWGEGEQVNRVNRVMNIRIPASVTLIEFDEYGGCMDEWPTAREGIKLEILSDRISYSAALRLLTAFSIPKADWSSSVPALFKEKDGILISATGKTVYDYLGTAEEVVIPDGVETVDREAFEGKTTIKKLIFPSSLTSIKEEGFRACKSLTEVVIPEDTKLTDIEEGAFLECVKLDPQPFLYIKGITVIKTNTFRNTAWKSLYIPAHIKEIDCYAFISQLIDGDPNPYVTYEDETVTQHESDSFVSRSEE